MACPGSGGNHFRQTGAVVRFDGDKAFYSPATDHIQMPPQVPFATAQDFAGRWCMNSATGRVRRCGAHGMATGGDPAIAPVHCLARFECQARRWLIEQQCDLGERGGPVFGCAVRPLHRSR